MSVQPPNKTLPQDKDIVVSGPKVTGPSLEREQLSVVLDNLDQGLQAEIARAEAAEAAINTELDRVREVIIQNEDSMLIEGGNWTFDGTILSWSADAYIAMPNLPKERNKLAAGSSNLDDGQLLYVLCNRLSGANVTLTYGNTDPATFAALPQSQRESAYIIARRIGNVIYGAGFKLGLNEIQKVGEGLSENTKTLLGILTEAQSSPAWNTSLGAPLKTIPADTTPVMPAVASMDTELSKYFGQFKLQKHATVASKGVILGADKTVLDQAILSQEISGLLVAFDGAVVDFATGVITKGDGTTALGINFTPTTLTPGQYLWYSLSLTPDTVTSINMMGTQVIVNPGVVAPDAATAQLPVMIEGIKMGAYLVRNNAGTIEIVGIRQLGSSSGSSATASTASLLDPKETETYLYYARSDFAADKKKFFGSTTGSEQILGLKKVTLNVGQEFITSDLTGSQVYADSYAIDQGQAVLLYSSGGIDTGVQVEMTRNGGQSWVAATEMRMASAGNLVLATVNFTQESTVLVNSTGNGANVSGSKIAVIYRPAYRQTVSSFAMRLALAGATSGTVIGKIYTASFGIPNTLIATSGNTLVAGQDITTTPANVTAYFSGFTLEAGTDYAIVFEGGGLSAALVANTATSPDTQIQSSATNSGSSWTPNAAKLVCQVNGTGCDLRMKVISATNASELQGFGVNFVWSTPALISGDAGWEQRVITSSEAATGLVTLANLKYVPGAHQLQVIRSNLLYTAPDFTEINSNAVQFPPSFLTTGQTVRFQTGYGLVDSTNALALQMNSRLTGMYDAIVGTAQDVLDGKATHASLQGAISTVGIGARVLLITTVTENVTIPKKMSLEGRGYNSAISGTLTITGTNVLVNMINVSGDITFSLASAKCFINNSWQTAASNVVDTGTQNLYIILDA